MRLYPTKQDLKFRKKQIIVTVAAIAVIGVVWFVLTREPMSICPFCSTDADWPADIVVVQLSEPVVALPFDRPISVTGTLELGTEVDAETGFVSLVRIQAQSLEAL